MNSSRSSVLRCFKPTRGGGRSLRPLYLLLHLPKGNSQFEKISEVCRITTPTFSNVPALEPGNPAQGALQSFASGPVSSCHEMHMYVAPNVSRLCAGISTNLRLRCASSGACFGPLPVAACLPLAPPPPFDVHESLPWLGTCSTHTVQLQIMLILQHWCAPHLTSLAA
jgi:hypothetical protein